jgi:serine/threonine protein phosphatase PrpC
MGAFLDKPKTEKTSSRGEGYGGLRYAVSAMQGWRTEMEDAHVCATEFALENSGFFGVFDGHAGPGVSLHCAENMLDTVLKFVKENEATHDDLEAKIEKIMKESFFKLDEKLQCEFLKGDDHSGTTAVVALITPTLIVIANCGDSRAILCSNGMLDFCTTDHKPYNVEEKARIEKAGGTVMMQRVNGSLAVSRALGDFDYKRNTSIPPIEQLVSPEPDVTIIPRNNDKEEFLLLACDGIYDVMSNDEIISYIRHKLSLTSDLEKICNDLIDLCLNKNSRDNMSVVLITFPNAPKVSSEAIEQEEKDLEKKQDELFSRLEKMVEIAHDPLDVEENHIMQQLTSDQSSDNFIVYEM